MPDNERSIESPRWVTEIFDRLEKWEAGYTVTSHLTALDTFPAWVERIAKEIFSQQFPALDFGKDKFDANTLGRFLGQQCARLYRIGEAFAKVQHLENKLTPDQLKVLEKIAALFAKDSVMPTAMAHFEEFVSRNNQIDEFAAICHLAFKEALEQESYDEAVRFFVGFANGLKNWPKDLQGAFTEATPVYRAMFWAWPQIERLGSVTELRKFLLTQHLSEQQLGDKKRLEKLCHRIGLKFRKRGRPPKIKSDTRTS